MLKKYKVKYNLHHYPAYSENKEIVIEAHSKEEAEEEFQDYDNEIKGNSCGICWWSWRNRWTTIAKLSQSNFEEEEEVIVKTMDLHLITYENQLA